MKLAVVVLKSPASQPKPDPVVYLAGGPGGSSLLDLEILAKSPILAQRNLILIDPRGTGRSQPNLACPEVNKASLNFYTAQNRPQPFQQALPLLRGDARQCASRLRNRGIDLSAYNSIEVAADIADLRKALGIKEWNLYGVSYGTRPALEAMRSYPEGVRSVVLDSGYPPDELETRPTRFVADVQRGLNHLFAACRGDRNCNAWFPNLAGQFSNMVNRYNRQPYRTRFQISTGTTRAIEITGNDLLAFIWKSLYEEQLIPSLPALIQQLAAGNTKPIDDTLVPVFAATLNFTPQEFAVGTQLSVDCADTGRYINAADRTLLNNPGIYASLLPFQSGVYCDAWKVKPVPTSFNQPVRSKIPTLLIAGSFDPASLPEQTRQAGAKLARSTYVEIPNAGHAPTLTSNCAQSILIDFLANPVTRPNTTCTRSLKVRFVKSSRN